MYETEISNAEIWDKLYKNFSTDQNEIHEGTSEFLEKTKKYTLKKLTDKLKHR